MEQIPFADGEIRSISLDLDGLVIRFCDWRDRWFEFVFPDHHWMSERYAINAPLDRVEIVSSAPVLTEVIESLVNEGLPESTWGSLNKVNFISADSDPNPVLSIIADELRVRGLEYDVG